MIRLPLSNAQENMEKKSLMFFPPPSSSLAFEDLSTQDQNMANCTSFYKPTSDISTAFDVPVDSSMTTSNLHTSSQPSESEGKSNKRLKAAERKMKKPRYAFQTRSQVDILDDGYRWRKYGQKAVKNNKFPRSYYRCTYQGCTVKKQVQRLSMDEGVVMTTYEGMHTHTIEKSTDNFEHILSQMQIYSPNF